MACASPEFLARDRLCRGCTWKHACILSVFIQADIHRNFNRSETSTALYSWADRSLYMLVRTML